MDAFPKPFIQRVRYDDQFAVSLETAYGERADDERAALDAMAREAGYADYAALPDGLLRSLLVDGIVAGAGGVLVFLPQILILFFFILVLEDCGYLPRAAFLLAAIIGTPLLISAFLIRKPADAPEDPADAEPTDTETAEPTKTATSEKPAAPATVTVMSYWSTRPTISRGWRRIMRSTGRAK